MSTELSPRLMAAHPFTFARLELPVSAVPSDAEFGAECVAGSFAGSVAGSGVTPASRFALDTAPLTVGELVAFTQFLAREVRAGAHVVDFNPDQRWHRRLYRDGRVDVWLISWLPEQGTQLHDHGGSSGSFTVVEGRLSEAVLARRRPGAGTLRERRHQTGATVGFDGRHVHDVRNLDSRPAVSVHAYSPPLTSMTFYDIEEGNLVPFAELDTNDPETPSPGPRSAASLVPVELPVDFEVTHIAGTDNASADIRSADVPSADNACADIRSADVRSADIRSAVGGVA